MKKIILGLVCIGMLGCGTIKRLVKPDRGDKSDTATSTTSQSRTGKIQPPSRPGVLNSTIHFLPSYQGYGGAHLQIDSLNTVIYLDEKILADMEDYLKTREADADSGKAPLKIVRYYHTNATASDLLLEQISPEKAQNQTHFRGIFDEHGNLLSLEFFDKDTVEVPERDNLEFGYVSYWNILLNRPLNYWNKKNYRSPAHAKIYTDPEEVVHYISYTDEGRELASGVFTYGVKNLILEQRIEFYNNGKLTDLHPDYFSPKFSHIEKKWIAKCLYSRDGVMSDLIVMLDAGVVFYRYRFEMLKSISGQLLAVSVLNAENQIVDKYELFFDDEGNLLKKTLLRLDGGTQGWITYRIDVDNSKVIVDRYDHAANHLNRFYREL